MLTDANVLLIHEAGCRGGAVARAIHRGSARWRLPLLTVDCGSDDAATLIADLARSPNSPRRTEAKKFNGGTVFLDGVNDMSRAVQEQCAEWLDSEQHGNRPHHVRIIAGSRQDLRSRVFDGTFRQDLYYRLAVLVIEIPPLHDRREDLQELFVACLADVAKKTARSTPRITNRLVDLLQQYSWPGNLRELECVAERLLVSCSTSRLDPSALPEEIRTPRGPHHEKGRFPLPPEGVSLDDLEKQLIIQALERHGDNRTHAARTLGLSRQTLLYRMQKHGLR
jgi:DNA-binding NtrC family response regulator